MGRSSNDDAKLGGPDIDAIVGLVDSIDSQVDVLQIGVK
jgi:hypothetical protein